MQNVPSQEIKNRTKEIWVEFIDPIDFHYEVLNFTSEERMKEYIQFHNIKHWELLK